MAEFRTINGNGNNEINPIYIQILCRYPSSLTSSRVGIIRLNLRKQLFQGALL